MLNQKLLRTHALAGPPVFYDELMRTQYRRFRAVPSSIANYISEAAELTQRSTILDVGTGPGSLAMHLARCGHNVTAIDKSLDFLKLATADSKRRGLAVRYLKADANAIDSLQRRFDVITAAQVMHWLDFQSAMRGFRISLSQAGSVFFIESKPLLSSEHPLKLHFGYGFVEPEQVISECMRQRDEYIEKIAGLDVMEPDSLTYSSLGILREQKHFGLGFAMSYFFPRQIDLCVGGLDDPRTKLEKLFASTSPRVLAGTMFWAVIRFEKGKPGKP